MTPAHHGDELGHHGEEPYHLGDGDTGVRFRGDVSYHNTACRRESCPRQICFRVESGEKSLLETHDLRNGFNNS